jgi:hypothetical protein
MLGQWIGSLVSIPYRARYEPRMGRNSPFAPQLLPQKYSKNNGLNIGQKHVTLHRSPLDRSTRRDDGASFRS